MIRFFQFLNKCTIIQKQDLRNQVTAITYVSKLVEVYKYNAKNVIRIL